MKSRFKFVRQVFSLFGQDKVGQLSAAFAYIAIFSLGPLLLVVINVVGHLFGQEAASGTLFNQLSSSLGSQTAKTLQSLVANTHKSSNGTLALAAGAIGLVLGATGLTMQLQNSFDSIFGVVPDPAGGIKRTIYVKVKNAVLIVIGGAAAMISLISSALIVGVAKKTSHQMGMPTFILEVIDDALSFFVFSAILFGIYKILPSVRLPTSLVTKTALAVSMMFLLGKIVLGIIIGRNGTASAYGAAASLVTLLLWIYYSGQILFLGAEGMKAYGVNNSLNFIPKKFNLKRQAIVYDSKGHKAKLLDAFIRGTRKSKKS
jgi:membrane protein